MTRPTVAVVLAGGTGTRLYPASTSDRPKQFLALGGDRSLLERAVDRANVAEEVYVLTRPSLAADVRDQVPDAAVLTEPVPKDTGPALVYAAHRIRDQVGPCTLVCLPSDHHTGPGLVPVLERAAATAEVTDGLVTIGVEPDRPATGYGYIEPGERLAEADPDTEMDATPDASPGATAEQTPAEDEVRDEPAAAVSQVAAFVEKPDAETARAYCDRGWYWNAGIFAWSPSALLEAARDGPLAPLVEHLADGEPVAGFDAVEPISIDYAVMEEATNAFVVPAAIEWDDLGSWDAVGRILPTDDAGNASLGETLALDAADNVVATDGHVSVVGVSGLIVATFGNRTVVLPRGKGERVREIATTLTESSTADTEPKQS